MTKVKIDESQQLQRSSKKLQNKYINEFDKDIFNSMVRKFNKIDYQDISKSKLEFLLERTLFLNTNDSSLKLELINPTEKYSGKKDFFRVRKLSCNDLPLCYESFWNPPAEKCNDCRINKKGQSLLYISFRDVTAIREINLKKGDTFLLIVYKRIEPLILNRIGIRYDYRKMPFLNEKVIEVNNCIMDFLNEVFLKKVSKGFENQYWTSQIIAEKYFPLEKKDGWIYNSSRDNELYNVCLDPKQAKKKLLFAEGIVCKMVDENSYIRNSVYYIDKQGELCKNDTFYKNSEIQKIN